MAHEHAVLEQAEFLYIWVGIAPALKDCVRRFHILNISEPKQILINLINGYGNENVDDKVHA